MNKGGDDGGVLGAIVLVVKKLHGGNGPKLDLSCSRGWGSCDCPTTLTHPGSGPFVVQHYHFGVVKNTKVLLPQSVTEVEIFAVKIKSLVPPTDSLPCAARNEDKHPPHTINVVLVVITQITFGVVVKKGDRWKKLGEPGKMSKTGPGSGEAAVAGRVDLVVFDQVDAGTESPELGITL